MIKQFTYVKRYFLIAVLTTIGTTGLLFIGFSNKQDEPSKTSNMQLVNMELSSLKSAEAWINSPSLTASELKGKVVLIQFCTYTCINWLRTLPYVRAWAETYKDKGLVVIGVHTPEFPFEKNINNVRQAIKNMNIDFPIAIDNKQDIWNTFNNQYWPALYFIDAKGKIRHHQFGEGEYEESEKVIQQLLVEAGAKDISSGLSVVNASGVELAADWSSLRSGENYLGYERTENFANHELKYGRAHVYAASSNLRRNQWSLSGNWTVQQQSIKLNKANGKLVYSFHARDLHLVMGPAVGGIPVRFRVLINGKPPETAHGIDIDEQGNGHVIEQRMYQLIRQPKPVEDRLFEIEFLTPGIEVFAFTFG
jgi:thiol-disulfide isomerase/thioredoxin